MNHQWTDKEKNQLFHFRIKYSNGRRTKNGWKGGRGCEGEKDRKRRMQTDRETWRGKEKVAEKEGKSERIRKSGKEK